MTLSLRKKLSITIMINALQLCQRLNQLKAKSSSLCFKDGRQKKLDERQGRNKT